MLDQGWQCQLAYIDGSHLFEDVFIDFFYIARLLAPAGVVLFDDSTDPHVRKVLRFIENNLASNFEPFPLVNYRPSAQRGLRYRLARRFRRVQLTAYRKIRPAHREWNAPFRSF